MSERQKWPEENCIQCDKPATSTLIVALFHCNPAFPATREGQRCFERGFGFCDDCNTMTIRDNFSSDGVNVRIDCTTTLVTIDDTEPDESA